MQPLPSLRKNCAENLSFKEPLADNLVWRAQLKLANVNEPLLLKFRPTDRCANLLHVVGIMLFDPFRTHTGV